MNLTYRGEMQLLGYGESDSSGRWIKLRLPEDEGDPLENFRGLKGQPFAVVMQLFEDIQEDKPKPEKGPHGEYWRALMAGKNVDGVHVTVSDMVPILETLGTDAEFLEWVRQRDKCRTVTGRWRTGIDCQGPIVAAHVRRIEKGAGTGIKPKFSAIPLCDLHHKLQHQHGESHLAPKWAWDNAAADVRREWFHGRMLATFEEDSLSKISPEVFHEWCERHGVEKYLESLTARSE